jgi:acetylornithine deacetylase/succinyl-diaminopimelate desuccinylase-like protein
MYSILRNKNEGLKPHVLDFARQLVAESSPSFQEERVAELVEAKMHEIGYDKVFRDDTGNVVGVLFGREAAPTTLLNSHMDTVVAGASPTPAADAAEPGRAGWICGAGAADCKGGLAAQIFAGALLKRSLLPLRGNLVVAASVAEDNGRSVGVRALLEHTLPELGLHPACAILGEPTDLGLYYGHDGWMEFNIMVKGPNPFQVNDAVSAIFNDLKSYEGSPSGDAAQDVQRSTIQWPRFRDDEDGRSASIAMMRRLGADESASNVVSSISHHAKLAARSGAAVAVDVMIAEEIRKLYTGRTATVNRVTSAWSTDPFHPLMTRAQQALAAADCGVRPGKWRLGRLGMGTAGSVLTREFKVPVIGYGPGSEDMAHAADERVEESRITEAVYGTASIVHSLVGIPVCGWTSDDEI